MVHAIYIFLNLFEMLIGHLRLATEKLYASNDNWMEFVYLHNFTE